MEVRNSIAWGALQLALCAALGAGARATPVPDSDLALCVEAARERMRIAAAGSVEVRDSPDGGLAASVLDVRPGAGPSVSLVRLVANNASPVLGQSGVLGPLAVRVTEVRRGYAVAAIQAPPDVVRNAGTEMTLRGPGVPQSLGAYYVAMPWDVPSALLGGFGVSDAVATLVLQEINADGIPWIVSDPDFSIRRLKGRRSEDGNGWVPVQMSEQMESDFLAPAYAQVLALDPKRPPYVTFALADSPMGTLSYLWGKTGRRWRSVFEAPGYFVGAETRAPDGPVLRFWDATDQAFVAFDTAKRSFRGLCMIAEGQSTWSDDARTWERIFESEGPARIAHGKGKHVMVVVDDETTLRLARGTKVWRLWHKDDRVFVAFVTPVAKRVSLRGFTARFLEVGWIAASDLPSR